MQGNSAFGLAVRIILFAALVAILFWAATKLIGLLVLAFGAIVVGVLLAGFASWIEGHSPLSGNYALAAAIVLILTILSVVGFVFGQQINQQFSSLAKSLPAILEGLKQNIESLPGGEQLTGSLQELSLGGDILAQMSRAVRSIAAAITDLLLLLFGSIFIAANPGLYRRGLLKLIPPSHRSVADDALANTGQALRKWMLGQLVSMTVIGLLTGLGLWLLGIPSAAALGLIAGASEIVPFAGPVLAAVPILLVALAEGPQTALLALALILVVQQIEGNLIMPYVQKMAVSLPPALTVFGVVAGGLLFGPIGVLFAAPLLVVAFVMVKRLYVIEALGTPTDMPGDGSSG